MSAAGGLPRTGSALAIWPALRRSGLGPGLLMLAVVTGLNIALQPDFFSGASLSGNIATFAPTILICVAQAVIVLSRELDLSLGAGVSLINCVMASLPQDKVGGPLGVMAIAILVAILLGAVNGLLVAYAGLPSLVATFATGAIWFGLALTIMPQPGGVISDAIGDRYAGTLMGIPVPLLIIAVAMTGWAILARHRSGRRIMAVGSNPQAARDAGIPLRRTKLLAYLVAWILVALGAIAISAQTLSGDPRLGTSYTLASVAAVVIGGISLGGGRGTPWGALVGALVLGLVTNVIYFAGIASSWQEFVKGLVIVAALGFMVLEGQRRA
ncbi:ABC transporter permease [Acidisoma silvae]|uniref:Autoinducer 2 import system permease protein LsrC n=1 Tax=Acidisoma silvae TaxID=2802396 RepID=A0A963YVV4_9PROT|nr:ABC transporter permease [Acidisoma silvae]MCB8877088.1 ABC transporter permease [Acidisoma silvae]